MKAISSLVRLLEESENQNNSRLETQYYGI